MATTAAPGVEKFSTEAGFSLVEVMVAAAILIIVLVPTAYLIASSSGLLTSNRASVTAAQLAASQLEADRTFADTTTWLTASPFGVSAASWPATLSVPSGGIQYSIARSTGWCFTTGGNATTWGTTAPGSTIPTFPSGMAGFKEVVTVTWRTGSLEASQMLQLPDSVVTNGYIPTTATSCPS